MSKSAVAQGYGLVLALPGLAGCDDALSSLELIQGTRVLGARVEVEGEPGRAAPAPGEAATVTFLVASPVLAPELGFALAICEAASGRGLPECAGEPFASVLSGPGELPRPALSFVTPAGLDSRGRLLVRGRICGESAVTANGTACDDGSHGTPVSLDFELSHEDDVNQNPAIEADDISLDGEIFAAGESTMADCAGRGYVELDSGSRHEFGVRSSESDRDPLPAEEGAPTRESLQLSLFGTAGNFSRVFSAIAGDSDALTRTVAWTAPKVAEPELVRVWFVLRDLRGGSDFTVRRLCVVP